MNAHRVIWRAAALVTVAVALLGTVLTVPLEGVIGMGIMLAIFGGSLGLTYRPDLPDVKHPVLAGAVLFMLPALYPGLAGVLGEAALVLVGLLVLTSPWVTTRLVRWLRGRVLPTADQAAMEASPAEALRLQWEESTRQLARAASVPDQLLLVRLREQILDDVLARNGGVLPTYVWAGTRDLGGPATWSRGG
jgi:hypothetical protein